MKKLLSMLGAFGLVATSSATVVACGDKNTDNSNDVVDKTIDLNKIMGDNASLYVYYDGYDPWEETPPGLPDGQGILDAFNRKNNLDLKLSTDVTVESIEEIKPPVMNDPRANGLLAMDFTATIKAVKTSEIVKPNSKSFVTATISPFIDLNSIAAADNGIWTQLSLYYDDIKAPNEKDILDAFNKLNVLDLYLNTDVTIGSIEAAPAQANLFKKGRKPQPTTEYVATIEAAKDSKVVEKNSKAILKITIVKKVNL